MSAWISTKDRLPDKEGVYLTARVLVNDYVIYEVMHVIENGKWKKRQMGFHADDWEVLGMYETEVDAWMPIEPWEGGYKMKDKEYLFYMVGLSETAKPSGTRYETFEVAKEAAERFSKSEGRKHYVIECCMVCNTVAEIGGEQE